ncbi:MAG: hypothetical protein RBT11_01740 [Desulfobacterales bacterium]|jgi:hypothetical protein|nr:hypothetical protein [Desulfobacterales bacterium]
MKYPEIGEEITTERAIELCEHFELAYLVKRIRENAGNYKSWKFDGCSILPDELMGLLTGCDWRDIAYKCCLPHDLKYAYGDPENGTERSLVDIQFRSDLMLKADMPHWCAYAFHSAVQVGGAEIFGLSFSWGFARITTEKGE